MDGLQRLDYTTWLRLRQTEQKSCHAAHTEDFMYNQITNKMSLKSSCMMKCPTRELKPKTIEASTCGSKKNTHQLVIRLSLIKETTHPPLNNNCQQPSFLHYCYPLHILCRHDPPTKLISIMVYNSMLVIDVFAFKLLIWLKRLTNYLQLPLFGKVSWILLRELFFNSGLKKKWSQGTFILSGKHWSCDIWF